MNLTGHGTGRTPEEARANAKADLQDQIAMMEFGNIVGQAIAGILAFSLTFFLQFLFRPIPTLIVGAVSWLIWLLVSAIVVASLPENPLGAVAIIVFLSIGGAAALGPLSAVVAISCATLEVLERGIMRALPELLRIPIALVTVFVPTYVLIAYGTTVNWTGGSGQDTPGFWSAAFMLFLLVVQLLVINARQKTGEAVGDYNWFGRRISPKSDENPFAL